MTTALAQPIQLLNASYEVLSARVTPQKAARLLALDKVTIEEGDPERRLGQWIYPRILKLRYYVRVAYEKLNGPPRVSKRGVLLRDHRICAYCGQQGASTIDHVVPRSRGGKNIWRNLVASCPKCNRRKGNRTPEEVGMPLLWRPYVPKRSDLQNTS